MLVQKTVNRFSLIPIDQYHEQNNAILKGEGGMKGLAENPNTFRKWAVAAPQQCSLIKEFESTFLNMGEQGKGDHHSQSVAVQNRFKQDVMSLLAEFNKCGNPFKETCPELVQIHTSSCANQKAIEGLRSIVVVGKEQYQQFVKERFVERTRTINDTSKRNSLTIFKEKVKLNIKSKQREVNLKSDYSLFSRLFIANQPQHGDMADFFSHENHPWPPSLSDNGKLRLPPSKSNLLLNFKPCNVTADMTYDAVVVDAPVHSLPTNDKINTFNDYLQGFHFMDTSKAAVYTAIIYSLGSV